MSRLKVLFLLSEWNLGYGGVQNYCRQVVHAAAAMDSEIDVLVLRDRVKDAPPPGGNVRFHLCAFSPYLPIQKIVYFSKFVWLLLSRRPKVVVCGHLNLAVLPYLVNLLVCVPYMVQTYGIEVWETPETLRRRSIEKADVVFFISQFSKSRLIEKFRIPENRFELLSPAVDVSVFSTCSSSGANLARKLGLEDKKVILTVSRLDRNERGKGHGVVLEAIKELTPCMSDLTYIIVGRGDYADDLKKHAKTLGIEDRVKFAGYVPEEELPAYYRLCDVFAMPSSKEGFGIVFLEALASGKPVIAGKFDGSSAPLQGGRLGLMVDPGNQEAVTTAIRDVLEGNVEPHLLDSSYLQVAVETFFGPDVMNARVREVLSRFV